MIDINCEQIEPFFFRSVRLSVTKVNLKLEELLLKKVKRGQRKVIRDSLHFKLFFDKI